MANWKFDYTVNGNSPGDKRLKVNFRELGKGFRVVAGGGILLPNADAQIPQVAALAETHLEGLNNLPANDPANHSKCLRAFAAYCTELADLLDNPPSQ